MSSMFTTRFMCRFFLTPDQLCALHKLGLTPAESADAHEAVSTATTTMTPLLSGARRSVTPSTEIDVASWSDISHSQSHGSQKSTKLVSRGAGDNSPAFWNCAELHCAGAWDQGRESVPEQAGHFRTRACGRQPSEKDKRNSMTTLQTSKLT